MFYKLLSINSLHHPALMLGSIAGAGVVVLVYWLRLLLLLKSKLATEAAF